MKLEPADSFERLGLPRRFAVDAAELERNYLERSRHVHPDFSHGNEDAAAELNAAYRTLRDPFTRAEHLLSISAGPGPSEDKTLPPAFLMEMLELREEIEMAKNESAVSGRIEADLKSRLQTLETSIGNGFESHDVLGVRRELNCARYLTSLLRDLGS